MEKTILGIDEITAWAFCHKEKYGKSRRVYVGEIKEYAKEVVKLCKDMFDFDVEFHFRKSDLKQFVRGYQSDIKYVEDDQTVRLKTFASTKYLLSNVMYDKPIVLELERALLDPMIAKKVFGEKEKERE